MFGERWDKAILLPVLRNECNGGAKLTLVVERKLGGRRLGGLEAGSKGLCMVDIALRLVTRLGCFFRWGLEAAGPRLATARHVSNEGGGGLFSLPFQKRRAVWIYWFVFADEYTKITTPRQDVLFKKGYLGRKKAVTPVAPNGEIPNGIPHGIPNGATNGVLNGESSPATNGGKSKWKTCFFSSKLRVFFFLED